MRAAHYDLTLETGVDFARAFEMWQPTGTLITAADVVPGQRIYLDGLPQRVHGKTTVTGTDGVAWVDLVFGQGAWCDPHLRVLATDMVMPAQPLYPNGAQAAFNLSGTKKELPTAINGSVVLVTVNHDESAALSPAVGAWSWDLFTETDEWGWQRLVEGTLTIVRSEARP